MTDTTETDLAEFDRYMTETQPPCWSAAFHISRPVRKVYWPGQHVWMYDHYNTAEVMNKTERGYLVKTVDADGAVSLYDYEVRWLRPAVAKLQFVFPSLNPASQPQP